METDYLSEVCRSDHRAAFINRFKDNPGYQTWLIWYSGRCQGIISYSGNNRVLLEWVSRVPNLVDLVILGGRYPGIRLKSGRYPGTPRVGYPSTKHG